MPTPQRGCESIEIAAPPEVVYDLLADITRMGEWSPECYQCAWLNGVTAAKTGARFRGYNRLGLYRWERTAIITAADRGRKFSFTTVDDRTGREQTQWLYAFEPLGSGTRVTESFQFLWCPAVDRLLEVFVPRGRQVDRGIQETLRRLKQAAESTNRPA
jgi:hypothetical protein